MNKQFKGRKESVMKFLVEIGRRFEPIHASFSEILAGLVKVAGGFGTGFTIHNVTDEVFEKMSSHDGFGLDDFEKYANQIKPIAGYAEHYKGGPWRVNGGSRESFYLIPSHEETKEKGIMESHKTRNEGCVIGYDRDGYVYQGRQLYTTETGQTFLQKALPAFDSFFKVNGANLYNTHAQEENEARMNIYIYLKETNKV